MSRGITDQLASAFASGAIQPFWLLELGFTSGTDYFAGLDHDVDALGHTYTRGLGVMSISPIEDTGDSVQGLQVQVAGALSANIALALTERVQGRPIVLRSGLVVQASEARWVDSSGIFRSWVTSTGAPATWGTDGPTLLIDPNVWAGTMDTLTIDGRDDSMVVTISAEHPLATWDRPRPVRYTHAQQQLMHPGDLGLEYVASLAEKQIVWPGKAFFKV